MSDSIKTFKAGYILLPVLIGLSVVGWLFYREFNPELFSDIHFSWRLVGGLLLAILFMFGRDGGLMWRFRFITDRELTWRQAFRVNMLCEFTSAVTPSAVGGSSLIVLFLNKEGINAGRSTALTISCLFWMNCFLYWAARWFYSYFRLMICLVMWLYYRQELRFCFSWFMGSLRSGLSCCILLCSGVRNG